MKASYDRYWFVIPLLVIFGVLLYLADRTQNDLLGNLATIPLEMIIGAVLVDEYLARKERQKRSRQLMFIKSVIFRSELRGLYLANFAALEQPPVTMSMIRAADLTQLRELRVSASTIRYRSPEAMEQVILEYVEAYPVFYGFMEWAIANDFERIFEEMVFLLHLIHDIRAFKEKYPNRLFIEFAQQDTRLMARVTEMLETGIGKFLDYVIELKSNQPMTFDDLLADYEAASEFDSSEWQVPSRANRGHNPFPTLKRTM